MALNIVFAILFGGFCFASCAKPDKTNSENTNKNEQQRSKPVNMKSYISIFEIPATDITRAINFYQSILEIKIEKVEMPEMQIGVLPYEEQLVTGVIMQVEGSRPSADGVTIYLNGGDNLQAILDKVEKSGGKIVTPKTIHADESGYFAIFLDSEGNRMGLHSVK